VTSPPTVFPSPILSFISHLHQCLQFGIFQMSLSLSLSSSSLGAILCKKMMYIWYDTFHIWNVLVSRLRRIPCYRYFSLSIIHILRTKLIVLDFCEKQFFFTRQPFFRAQNSDFFLKWYFLNVFICLFSN